MQLSDAVRAELERVTQEQRELQARGKVSPYPGFVARLFKHMATPVESLLHAAVGQSGESGEVLDLIKKTWIYNKPIDEAKLIEELGDARYYYTAALNLLGVTDEQVEAYNKRKLLKRFPDGYTDQAAQQRVDVTNPGDNVVNYTGLEALPSKPVVRIEDWYIIGLRLFGMAQNHPKAPVPGKPEFVSTSRIIHRDQAAGRIETLNTIYELGRPAPDDTSVPA